MYWYNLTVQRIWETNNHKLSIYQIEDESFDYINYLFLDDLFIVPCWFATRLYVYNFTSFKGIICDAINDIEIDYINLHKNENYLIEFIPKVKLAVWDLNDGSQLCYKLLMDETHIYKKRIFFSKYDPFTQISLGNYLESLQNIQGHLIMAKM